MGKKVFGARYPRQRLVRQSPLPGPPQLAMAVGLVTSGLKTGCMLELAQTAGFHA